MELDIFSTPLKEKKEACEEIYDLGDFDDYDDFSEYENYDYIQNEKRQQKIFNLEHDDFPSSFISLDFENLYPQRVSACSVGMVKYKNGKIIDRFYTLIRPPFDYERKKGPALTWIHGFT